MLRKQVKPLVLDMKKQKKKDYKSVVEEIQDEGQELDTQSRTDSATRLALQAIPISKSSRSRHNYRVVSSAKLHGKDHMAQLLDPRLIQERIRSHLHLFTQCIYSRMGTSEGLHRKSDGC